MPMRPYIEGEDLSRYLVEIRRELKEELLRELKVPLFDYPPRNPEEGMIVRADGVGWNPGNGGGFYGRHGNTWRYLG